MEKPSATHVKVANGAEGSGLRCGCGWSVAPASSEARLQARWEVHLRTVHAFDSRARAEKASASVVARGADLARLRGAARLRRGKVRASREVLRWEIERRRIPTSAGGAAAEPHIVGDRLERARVLAEVSVRELWLDYLALGGNATLGDLVKMLRGSEPISVHDHDVVVVALNERFSDAGLGRPLDLWGAP